MNENTNDTPEGRGPRWNVASVSMPFAGFLCGFVEATTGASGLWHGHPMNGIFWGVLIWATFCVLGLVAAAIAWVRAERLRGLTFLGFALNAPLPFAFLAGALSAGWNPVGLM